mmetsp:Transcript_3378/g.6944  ORF Transcript_3378/g.6944 Transcript_3378/m.6944 type:complete len:477 (+) Transcript_3378:1287-2717(+)
MKIVVCTDVHLGFEEKDPIRSIDSYAAFEEVLQRANAMQADLVLVGGDLFHDQSPSTECFNRTLELLSAQVLGQRTSLEVISESRVNWDVPDVSIRLPVMSIHGNHDEPLIETGVSALHLLDSSKLLTYLRHESFEGQLHVRPVVVRKPGGCTVAVYGMGFVKDQILHQMFKEQLVVFHKANADVHILLLHQNRYKGQGQGTPHEYCLPEHWIPDFIDIVIWGNEHESMPDSQAFPIMKCRVIQPGSTVPTSLIAAEAKPKHAILIEAGWERTEIITIPLTTPRQFFFTQLELSEICRTSDEAEAYIRRLLDSFLSEAHGLPLIRIKAEVTGFEHVRVSQINSEYSDKVANKKVLATWKRRVVADTTSEVLLHCEKTELLDLIQDQINSMPLELFSPTLFQDALKASVEHGSSKDFDQLWDSRVSEMTQACAEVELGALNITEVLARLNFTQKKPQLKRCYDITTTEQTSKRLKFT